jgi:hypothetical protein
MRIRIKQPLVTIGFATALVCCGCGRSGSIAAKVESSLKDAGYIIMPAEQSYALTHAFLDATITDTRTGQQYNPSRAVKEEDFAGTFYALDGATPAQGKPRGVCLRFCPKNATSRTGTMILLPLNQDVQKTVQVALSKVDRKVAAFICDSVAQYQAKRTTSFETSGVRILIDEAHGHGIGLLEIKPPIVRVEFTK